MYDARNVRTLRVMILTNKLAIHKASRYAYLSIYAYSCNQSGVKQSYAKNTRNIRVMNQPIMLNLPDFALN